MAKKDKRVPDLSAQVEYKLPATSKDGFFKRNLYQVIVFAFSFILFANSIPNDYNLDDELVTRNHRLTSKGIAGIPEIFKSAYYKDQFYAYEYRPVVLTTFAIEHTFFGDVPQVSHFINVLLYSLFCVLLFNTLKQIFPSLNPKFFLIATLLFAAHPSHTEVVDNIKCRDEILAFLFSLITLRTSWRFVKEIDLSRKILWGSLILPMFLLALLNKLTIISFIVIIPVTVILFAEAGLYEVIIISLCLILPSLLLVNMSGLVQKVQFGLLLFCANIVFYLFINRAKILSYFSTLSFGNLLKDHPLAEWRQMGSGFKVLQLGTKPSSDLVSSSVILINITLLAMFVVGMYFQLLWLFAIAIICLLALSIFGDWKMSWWATLGFYVACIGSLAQFSFGGSLFGDLIVLGLTYHIFIGRRDLALPAVVLLFVFYLISIVHGQWVMPYFIPFLFWRTKYAKPLVIFNVVVIIAAFIKEFIQLDPNIPKLLIHGYGTVFMLIMLAALLARKNMAILAATFKFMSVCFLFLVISNFGGDMAYNKVADINIQKVNAINPTLIPNNQNRPLDFIEQPVNNTSPLSIRIGTSAEILFHYFYKTILPYPLSFYYGYKFIVPMEATAPKALAGLIILVLLAAIGIWQLWKDKVISYWLFFYLISIIVFSNFLMPVPGSLGDRFLFIPSLAWCFLAVYVVFKLLKIDPSSPSLSWPKIPAYAKYGLVGLLAVYSTISFARNFDWKDDITLFSHDNSYVSNSAQANNLLAVHLIVRSNSIKNFAESEKLRQQAAEYFAKAVAIYPDFMNAYYDLGRSNSMLAEMATQANRPEDATRYYTIAADAFKNTIRLDSSFYDAVFQLAIVLDAKGDLNEAEKYYRQTILKQPTNLAAYTNLSYLYFRQKKMDQSLETNKTANRLMPQAFEPVVNIAKTYLNLDQTDSAFAWMEKAYAINPKDENLVRTLYDMAKRKGLTDKQTYYGRQLGIN